VDLTCACADRCSGAAGDRRPPASPRRGPRGHVNSRTLLAHTRLADSDDQPVCFCQAARTRATLSEVFIVVQGAGLVHHVSAHTQPQTPCSRQKARAKSVLHARAARSPYTHTHTVESARTRPLSLSLSLSLSLKNTYTVGERARSAGIEQKECAYVFRVRITCPPGYYMALPLTAKVRAVSSADALSWHRVREYPRFGRAGTLTARTCSGTPRRRHPRPGPAGSGCC
jgi:hypothetical protein